MSERTGREYCEERANGCFGIHYAAVRYLRLCWSARRFDRVRWITGILPGVSRIDLESVIQLGILIPIATQIVRVALHRRVTARTDWK